jgi:two-component system cell cycle response regulator
MTFSSYSEPPSFIRTLTKGYAVLILMLMGLVPAFAITYLYFFQDPALRFEHHGFHEIAIGISLLQSGFITYVTYRCYLHTKELFLRWLTLGFLAYGRQEQSALQARPKHFWLAWLGAFAVIDVLVFPLAFSEWARLSRWVMEIAAMGIMLSCALTIVVRRMHTPLMTVYALSVIFFAQSSLAFLLGSAWSHMWWLAHAIFATGFMALSYGVIQAFLTTGSFSRIYSQAELIEQVRAEKERTDDALLKLQRAHEELEVIAATDSLTGCANRREFEARGMAEVARVKRSGAPLSFVTIDLDHFKQINDRHGHRAGDEVLRAFITLGKKTLRPRDLVGRIGGEEFALILPDTPLEGATMVAERLRQLTESEVVTFAGTHIRFTVSLGVAQYGPDGDTYESVIEAADSRMYRAKQAGRNQVTAR